MKHWQKLDTLFPYGERYGEEDLSFFDYKQGWETRRGNLYLRDCDIMVSDENYH
jgi:hypothetical protein